MSNILQTLQTTYQQNPAAAISLLPELFQAVEEGKVIELPCKQYETVYYLLDGRVYIGWYLAKAGDATHLILQDRIEMGICWVTDGYWFLTRESAAQALKEREKNG